MSILNRAFTNREIAIILLLTLILLVLVYVRFAYIPMQDQLDYYESETAKLDSQILVEQGRARKIQEMQAQIETGLKEYPGEVKTYDNVKAEIDALNDILNSAKSFEVNFRQPTANGNNVRRRVDINFVARNYASARALIRQLHDCEYRCMITTLSMSPASRRFVHENGIYYYTSYTDLQNGDVSVSLSLTFYETRYGTDLTDGLLIES